jgi:uncharacterized protein YrrD
MQSLITLSSACLSPYGDERSMTMITKIQLQKKATVLAADGSQLGSLERVVLNPESNVITNVVVRTGNLLKHEEKVVPIELVAETADHKILLRKEAGDLEGFPPFEERRLVDEYGGRSKPGSSGGATPVVTGYSVLGTPMMSAPDGRIVTRVEQNIPAGTVAMKEGAKVVSADGKLVGVVERVLADPTAEQITDLLVSKGFLVRDAKLIPIQWVMSVGEEEVRLRVSRESVEDLNDLPIAE